MKTKTAYRPRNNIPAEEPPNIPEVKIDDEKIQPSASTRIDFTTTDDAEPSEAVAAAIEAATDADRAKYALAQQIQTLRKSEELVRQQRKAAAAARALPPTREGRLQAWKQAGMSDEDGRFLSEHPGMIDHPQVTQQAVAAALHAGIERGSPDFHTAVANNFNAMMARAEAPASATAQPTPTPEFFAPRPSPAPTPAAPDRSHIVSAPVSRNREAGGYREPSPRQVRLTAEEQQIARASGISDVQYAENKLRMLRAKASGDLQ
jgi:hypothetical protein